MPVKKLSTFDKVEQLFDVAAIKGTDELLFKYKDLIVQEMPKKTGQMAKDIKVVRTRKVSKGIYRAKIILDSEYALTVHEGVDKSEGVVHTANKQVMKFPTSAWPGGPEELSRNGFYYFKRVKYHIKPNKFLDRAEAKLLNILSRTLMNNIIVEFRTIAK